MSKIETVLLRGNIVPVLVVHEEYSVEELMHGINQSGLSTIEVTMRTPAGLTAIEYAAKNTADTKVGAGTVLTVAQANAAIDAGATFIVAPSYNAAVHEVCLKRDVPYLPGIQTISEASACAEKDLAAVKVFPASVAGGPSFLKALYSVMPELLACPTGGVNAGNANDYLAVPSVHCVGGSWMFKRELIASSNRDQIAASIDQAIAGVGDN